MHDEELAGRAPGEGRDVWAIVLAGGEGRRPRSMMRRRHGDGRPNPDGPPTASLPILRQTLRRAAMVVSPERTVVVSQAEQARYLGGDLAGLGNLHVLTQPSDRGTAAGAMLAAHWIAARASQCTVVLLPAGHLVAEAAALVAAVSEVARFVGQHPEWLVLLGLPPTGPDADHGWIEPGEPIGATAAGPVYRVRRFGEAPSVEAARKRFEAGCLRNTLVVSADLDTLIDAGRRGAPALHERFARLRPFLGTPHEPWALRQAYLFAPAADFSRAVLEPAGPRLAVAPAPGPAWCDVGTPDRVTQVLGWLRCPPAWIPEPRTGT
jgi:mannose-1-phosphate guanylyltransferase/mannose-6-phosphate isomerase